MKQVVLSRLLLVSALAPGLHCVGINPDWDEPVARETSGEPEGGDPDEVAGEETGKESEAGEGETDTGEELFCVASPAPIGPCPEVCDQCIDGECRIICKDEDCRDEELACPFGWPCRVFCADKQACRSSTLTCTGEWSCTLECLDHRACDKALVLCAEGPCRVFCSHSNKPCEDLELVCGSRDGEVACAGAKHDHGPQVIPQPNSACGCSNACEG